MEVNFSLKSHIFTLDVTVIANRALNRVTPVSYSTLTKKQVELSLGNRDLPMTLNTTPSVYATEQGGGAGDARIDVRGFTQNNVAVMINGIPVNVKKNPYSFSISLKSKNPRLYSYGSERTLMPLNLMSCILD